MRERLAQLSLGGSHLWRVVGSPTFQPGTCMTQEEAHKMLHQPGSWEDAQ